MFSLTIAQREVLELLVELYDKHKRMIRSKELAHELNKEESSIKNAISTLKALGFVESKSGPEGGYIPTTKGREFLRTPVSLSYEVIKLYVNGIISKLSVVEVEFLDLMSVVESRAILRIIGNLHNINVGDKVRFGPTPITRLVVEGVVIEKNPLRREIIISITTMASIPKDTAKQIMSPNLIYFSPDVPLKEVANTLYTKNIRGAPVIKNGKILGLITTSEISKALSQGDIDEVVEKYMRKEVHVVREDEDILTLIKKMANTEVGRLIVVDENNKPVGIVTRTDILRRIAGII